MGQQNLFYRLDVHKKPPDCRFVGAGGDGVERSLVSRYLLVEIVQSWYSTYGTAA